MTQLLVDTDAFCILGMGDALSGLAALLGIPPASCARLPALPYQLRRGPLYRRYGDERCERLRTMAEAMPVVPAAESRWLDLLAGVSDVDPGEAQLFAVGAERGAYVLTGDKRAIAAIRSVSQIVSAIATRIILPEAALLALCTSKGEDWVRHAVCDVRELDAMLAVCFSDGNHSPGASLSNYLRHDMKSLQPVALWTPPGWGAAPATVLETTSPS